MSFLFFFLLSKTTNLREIVEGCKGTKIRHLPPTLKIRQCLSPTVEERKYQDIEEEGEQFCIFNMSIFKHINIVRMTEGKP